MFEFRRLLPPSLHPLLPLLPHQTKTSQGKQELRERTGDNMENILFFFGYRLGCSAALDPTVHPISIWIIRNQAG